MSTLLNNETLLKFLNEKNLNATIEKDNQIFLLLKKEKAELPLFIKISQETECVQFFTFLPCQLESKYCSDTARLLHLINKDVDAPGFGMDELSSSVFYRYNTILDASCDTAKVESIINIILFLCPMFLGVIQAVTAGFATFEDILAKKQKVEENKPQTKEQKQTAKND